MQLMTYFTQLILFICLVAGQNKLDARKSAVTYTFSGGRFGDSLVAYCHAFWIAYQLDLDLLYKPFKYSDQLMMHDADMHYAIAASHYKQTLHVCHALQNGIQPDMLYIVPYFPESHFEYNDPRCPFLFQVDWKNQGFIEELKKRLNPQNRLNLPDIPKDCISVAVHIRKGTGWDIPQFAPSFEKLSEIGPLKWPPDSYYIEQINKILMLFPAQKIYFYIFTDHDNPSEISEQYSKEINSPYAIWKCRDQNNRHDLNVLEDFFALTQFDCLIRNDSNFSLIASKLANYKVLIAPWESIMSDGRVVITKIVLETAMGIGL